MTGFGANSGVSRIDSPPTECASPAERPPAAETEGHRAADPIAPRSTPLPSRTHRTAATPESRRRPSKGAGALSAGRRTVSSGTGPSGARDGDHEEYSADPQGRAVRSPTLEDRNKGYDERNDAGRGEQPHSRFPVLVHASLLDRSPGSHCGSAAMLPPLPGLRRLHPRVRAPGASIREHPRDPAGPCY